MSTSEPAQAQPEPLPQSVIDEAWSEFVYPRPAVGDLSHPDPQSGFMRAMRVIQQWARSQQKELPMRVQVWSVIADVRDAASRVKNDADAEDIIDALVDAGLLRLRPEGGGSRG